MKRIITVLAALFLLTSCASNKIPYANDKVLYTIGNQKVKESVIYDSLKTADMGSTIYAHMSKLIQENYKEDPALTEEIDKRTAEEVESLRKEMGDELEAAIISIGYKDLETFVKESLRPSVSLSIEIEKDIESNFDSVITDYKVKDIQLLTSDVAGYLDDVKKEIEGGKKMTDIELNGKAKLSSTLYTKSLDLKAPLLQKALNSLNKPGLSKVIYDKESEIYYLIEVKDTDLRTDFDNVVKALIANENFAEVHSAKSFTDLDFKIYDEGIYKDFKKNKPLFIK